MREFFIVANSKAAPFVSDTKKTFVDGDTPEQALETFTAGYSHPCGLYSAGVWKDANAYQKNKEPLARYLSDKAQKDEEAS